MNAWMDRYYMCSVSGLPGSGWFSARVGVWREGMLSYRIQVVISESPGVIFLKLPDTFSPELLLYQSLQCAISGAGRPTPPKIHLIQPVTGDRNFFHRIQNLSFIIRDKC